ncbi:hypothetical protein RRG08_031424 [Elysia crispata]|uniref:Uncharacterized protein n=1 Tax=Elysia crispata TaxID=231223 RepID=A0AAE0ZP25_9GAST|nr:hypothetical protein RRG08_031424 [Elysia crispata]
MEEEFDADKMEDDLDTVSRVRRPGAALHSVIMALFLILGESHREMADWKTLADMLSQNEKPEKRPVLRMSKFDPEAVTRDQARLAKKLLAPLTVDKVKAECEAATACFVWSKEKIQEVYDYRRSRGSNVTQTGYYQDISQWCSGVTEHKPLGSRTQTDLKQTENNYVKQSIKIGAISPETSFNSDVTSALKKP